jgi:hypothetical protein
MTMIEPNIWGAFRSIGVKYSVVYGFQRVSFDEMTLRESEGFKEHKHSRDPRESVNRTDRSGFGTAMKTLLPVSTILIELPSPDGSRNRFGGINLNSPIAIPSSLRPSSLSIAPHTPSQSPSSSVLNADVTGSRFTGCLILSRNHDAWEGPWHGCQIKRHSTSIVSAWPNFARFLQPLHESQAKHSIGRAKDHEPR